MQAALSEGKPTFASAVGASTSAGGGGDGYEAIISLDDAPHAHASAAAAAPLHGQATRLGGADGARPAPELMVHVERSRSVSRVGASRADGGRRLSAAPVSGAARKRSVQPPVRAPSVPRKPTVPVVRSDAKYLQPTKSYLLHVDSNGDAAAAAKSDAHYMYADAPLPDRHAVNPRAEMPAFASVGHRALAPAPVPSTADAYPSATVPSSAPASPSWNVRRPDGMGMDMGAASRDPTARQVLFIDTEPSELATHVRGPSPSMLRPASATDSPAGGSTASDLADDGHALTEGQRRLLEATLTRGLPTGATAAVPATHLHIPGIAPGAPLFNLDVDTGAGQTARMVVTQSCDVDSLCHGFLLSHGLPQHALPRLRQLVLASFSAHAASIPGAAF